MEHFYLESTCKSASLESGMKNKEQEIGGFDVLSFQLEMLQTTKCIFWVFFFPSDSWRSASKLCLGQKMSVQPISQLLSAQRRTQPPPAPVLLAGKMESPTSQRFLTILSRRCQRSGLPTRPAFLINTAPGRGFLPVYRVI